MITTFQYYQYNYAHPSVNCLIKSDQLKEVVDKEIDRLLGYTATIIPQNLSQREQDRQIIQLRKKFIDPFLDRYFFYTESDFHNDFGRPHLHDQYYYGRTLKHLENNYLKIPFPSLDNFHSFVKDLHSHLISPISDIQRGCYRLNTSPCIVQKMREKPLKGEGYGAFLMRIFPDKVSTFATNLEDFIKCADEGLSYSDMEKSNKIPSAALNFYKKNVFDICPPVREIPQLMSDLFLQVAKLIKEKKRVDAVVYTHMECTRIHPFEEANGRMARILMNMILMQGGYQPIQMSSEREYSKVIQEEMENKENGVFKSFVQKQILIATLKHSILSPERYEVTADDLEHVKIAYAQKQASLQSERKIRAEIQPLPVIVGDKTMQVKKVNPCTLIVSTIKSICSSLFRSILKDKTS